MQKTGILIGPLLKAAVLSLWPGPQSTCSLPTPTPPWQVCRLWMVRLCPDEGGRGPDLQLTLHSPSRVPWQKGHLSLTCTKASNGPGAVCTRARHVQNILTLEGCDLACHGLVYSQLLAPRGAEGRGGEAQSLLHLLHEGSETKFRFRGQNLPLLGPQSLHSACPPASGFRGQAAQCEVWHHHFSR